MLHSIVLLERLCAGVADRTLFLLRVPLRSQQVVDRRFIDIVLVESRCQESSSLESATRDRRNVPDTLSLSFPAS